jgi:DNA-binding MarR family transcriptional regulator
MATRDTFSELATPLALRRMQAEIHMNSARVLRGMERRVQALFEDEGIRHMTPAQGNVLMVLFHQRRPTRAKKLAQISSVSEVTMGRFVHALEASGWVERTRDPDDARAWLVSPTTQAYGTLGALIRVSNRMMDEAFQGFDADDIERFHTQTRRVVDNLAEQADRAPADSATSSEKAGS